MAFLDQKVLVLVVVIILIVVVAIVIFRRKFPDDDDRERHRHKLWWGIAIAVVLVIAAYWLWQKYPMGEAGEHGPESGGEYGYIDTFRRNREAAAIQRKAGKEAEAAAKASGGDKFAVAEAKKRAMQQAKQEQRDIKIAGQQAENEARDKARAALAKKK